MVGNLLEDYRAGRVFHDHTDGSANRLVTVSVAYHDITFIGIQLDVELCPVGADRSTFCFIIGFHFPVLSRDIGQVVHADPVEVFHTGQVAAGQGTIVERVVPHRVVIFDRSTSGQYFPDFRDVIQVRIFRACIPRIGSKGFHQGFRLVRFHQRKRRACCRVCCLYHRMDGEAARDVRDRKLAVPYMFFDLGNQEVHPIFIEYGTSGQLMPFISKDLDLDILLFREGDLCLVCCFAVNAGLTVCHFIGSFPGPVRCREDDRQASAFGETFIRDLSHRLLGIRRSFCLCGHRRYRTKER